MNGIYYIDKPKDMTSRDVVNIVSKKIGTRKVGHTGTLDPMATGVLVVCAGKATKVAEEITGYDKEYEAEVTLGVKTDTGDITGNVIEKNAKKITSEELKQVINAFPKKYLQEVPIYSAVKINGKKLYEYARAGIEVELPKRDVEIISLELISDLKSDKFKIKTKVSKGTYIRALIEDIARELGTVATMSDLRRTKQGKINIEDCISLEDVNNNNYKSILESLDLPEYEVDDEIKTKILYGQRIEHVFKEDKVLLYSDDEAIAICEVDSKDNKLMKPIKVFI